MGDGSTKIVLNTVGTADDVDPKLRAFLDYVAGKSVDDEYVKKLDAAVAKAKQNKEWRKEYMTLMMRDLENQEIGERKGEKKGEKKGAGMLASLLQQLDRDSEDYQLAINGTSEDRQKLYVQYKIVYEEVGEDTGATKDSEENNKKDSTEN